jgi:hypothetical protein
MSRKGLEERVLVTLLSLPPCLWEPGGAVKVEGRFKAMLDEADGEQLRALLVEIVYRLFEAEGEAEGNGKGG